MEFPEDRPDSFEHLGFERMVFDFCGYPWDPRQWKGLLLRGTLPKTNIEPKNDGFQ